MVRSRLAPTTATAFGRNTLRRAAIAAWASWLSVARRYASPGVAEKTVSTTPPVSRSSGCSPASRSTRSIARFSLSTSPWKWVTPSSRAGPRSARSRAVPSPRPCSASSTRTANSAVWGASGSRSKRATPVIRPDRSATTANRVS